MASLTSRLRQSAILSLTKKPAKKAHSWLYRYGVA